VKQDDLKPEYGDITIESWAGLCAKARELHAAIGSNPRWQYIAIEAFPELLNDNMVRLPRDEVIERLTDELTTVRRLNQAQGEALIALRHAVICWPANSPEEAALFDCSSLQVAREDVQAVQNVLTERDEAHAILRKILGRIAVGDVGDCIEDIERLAYSGLGEKPVEEK
jgi:hypothetical protein